MHSFTHAVSSILEHLKPTIANISQSALRDGGTSEAGPQALTRLWSECSSIEEQLEVVADLCGCVSSSKFFRVRRYSQHNISLVGDG